MKLSAFVVGLLCILLTAGVAAAGDKLSTGTPLIDETVAFNGHDPLVGNVQLTKRFVPCCPPGTAYQSACYFVQWCCKTGTQCEKCRNWRPPGTSTTCYRNNCRAMQMCYR